MYLHNTRAQCCILSHSRKVIGKEHHLAVTYIRKERELLSLCIYRSKTAIGELLLLLLVQAAFLQIFLPGSAKGRIRDAEIEGLASVTVARDGAVESDIFSWLGAVWILERANIPRDHQVGLARCISIRLQFLPEYVHLHLQVTFASDLQYAVLRYCEDASSTASAIINVVGVVRNLIRHGQHSQVCQQFHIVARCEVFTRLSHIVFLIELA